MSTATADSVKTINKIFLPAKVLNEIFCFLTRLFLGHSVSLVSKFHHNVVDDFFNEKSRRRTIKLLTVHGIHEYYPLEKRSVQIGQGGQHYGRRFSDEPLPPAPLPVPQVPPPKFIHQLGTLSIKFPYTPEMIEFCRLLCQAESPEFFQQTRLKCASFENEPIPSWMPENLKFNPELSFQNLTQQCPALFLKFQSLLFDSNMSFCAGLKSRQFRHILANFHALQNIGHLECPLRSILQIRPLLNWLDQPFLENSRWNCRRLDLLLMDWKYQEKYSKMLQKLFNFTKERFKNANADLAKQTEIQIWIFGLKYSLKEFRLLENGNQILELKRMKENEEEEMILGRIEEDLYKMTELEHLELMGEIRQRPNIYRLQRKLI